MYGIVYNVYFLVPICYASVALDRFISKKTTFNQHVKILNESENYVWIEYYYEWHKYNRRKNITSSQIEMDGMVDMFTNKNLFSLRRDVLDALNLEVNAQQINSSSDKTSYLKTNDTAFLNSLIDVDVESIECVLPIIESKFILVYKPEKLSSSKDIFIITFTGTLWLLFICILAISVVLFRICTKYYHVVYQDHSLWSWIDIAFWAIAASCQQGVSYAPHKFASCLIFLLVYLLAYLLYTVFTARITSTLLQETSAKFISDTTNMKFVTLNITHDLGEIQMNANMEEVVDMEDLFVLLENKDTVGVVPKIFLLQYLTHATENYNFYNVEDLPSKYKIVMLIRKINNNHTIVKQRMLTFLQSGLLKRSYNPLFRYKMCKQETRYYKADFHHIRSGVLLFCGGVGASLLFLIVEFIVAYCKHFY